MKYQLSENLDSLFWERVNWLENNTKLQESHHFMQHGTTSVYQHSIAVAYLSCMLAERWKMSVNLESLIVGAILHDYFLYDWHRKDKRHSWHGFRHPGLALTNAKRDIRLTAKEENIIARHMFPLVPVPPTCKEAWLVCMADKIVAMYETFPGVFARVSKMGQLYHLQATK